MNKKHFFAAVILLSLLVMGLQWVFAQDDTTLLISIDIKPGSYPNTINRDGNGIVPVAILGGNGLDVLDIDIPNLIFSGWLLREKPNGSYQYSIKDVNGDNIDDLVCQFVDEAPNWLAGDDWAYVFGNLKDGITKIYGEDEITIVP